MNWDMIGAASSLLGAVGVIASLLYLATQVRLASKTAQESAYRDLFTNINHQFHEMLAPENRKIIFKGLRGLGDLDSEERLVFDFLMIGYMNLIESSLLSNDAKIVADDLMANWRHHLRTRFMCYSGAVDWWGEAKVLFDPKTQSWVDNEILALDSNADHWKLS